MGGRTRTCNNDGKNVNGAERYAKGYDQRWFVGLVSLGRSFLRDLGYL